MGTEFRRRRREARLGERWKRSLGFWLRLSGIFICLLIFRLERGADSGPSIWTQLGFSRLAGRILRRAVQAIIRWPNFVGSLLYEHRVQMHDPIATGFQSEFK